MNLQWLLDAFNDAAQHVRDRAVFRVRTSFHELEQLRAERKAYDEQKDILKAQLEQAKQNAAGYQIALQNALRERNKLLKSIELHAEPFNSNARRIGFRLSIQLPCPPLENVYDYLEHRGWIASQCTLASMQFTHEKDETKRIVLPMVNDRSFTELAIIGDIERAIDTLMQFELRSNLDIYRDIMETFA